MLRLRVRNAIALAAILAFVLVWFWPSFPARIAAWQAARQFPNLESCLADRGEPSQTISLNWRAFYSDAQREICVTHLARHLGSPEKTAEWFEQADFKVSAAQFQWGKTELHHSSYSLAAEVILYDYDGFSQYFPLISLQTLAYFVTPPFLLGAQSDGGLPIFIRIKYGDNDGASPIEVETRIGGYLK